MSRTPQQNIFDAFAETAAIRGDRTAVIYLGTRFSYRRLLRLVHQFAAALVGIGITPGQRVMLYIPNSIQWVVAWLGILKIKAVCVPITPIYTPHDLTYISDNCNAETIICADTNFGYVKKVLANSPLKSVVITNMVDFLPWWKRCFGFLFDVVPRGKVDFDAHTFSFRRLLNAYRDSANDFMDIPESETDTAEILYTGGTTRYPKGVPITHRLFLISADEQIRTSASQIPVEDNTIFCNAPLFHILGQTCGLATLLVGGTLMLQPRPNLDAAFDAIQRFKAKTMIGVPTLYRMILEHDRLKQYDLGSVDFWFSAGDVLPEEVGNRWAETFGKRIHQGYGATETCGGVSMCPAGTDTPQSSVGSILPSKQIQIVDPALLEPVNQGDAGELIVSSDVMVTKYLNNPDETVRAFVELKGRTWYRTADIMSMDTSGNLYFVDRAIDTIKHKGYRISASEIEAVLQEHAAVISACAIGVPDDKTGQRVKAYVVLREDIKGITGYDLIKWCRDRLTAYKVPQYIEFRDMLPKSKVGKLLRREIRDEETRRMEG